MSSGRSAARSLGSALAEEAHTLVQVHPRRALAVAESAVAASSAERDAEAEVAALHALAWAQHVLGDPRAANTAKRGIRIAERNGDRRGGALLRRRLALTLAFAGNTRAALREIDTAIAGLSGLDRARSEVHRVEIQRRAHLADKNANRRLDAAATRALGLLRRKGDEIWEARLRYNVGLLKLDRGELGAAETHLRGALALTRRLGAAAAVVDVTVALASLALVRGDVLACLEAFEEVRSTGSAREPHFGLAAWSARALLQARLLPEARAAALAYVELCRRTGRGDSIATALLDLAAITAISGEPAAAEHYASQAARSFAARGKPVNAAVARAVRLRTRLESGALPPSSVRAGLDAAAVLARAGWRREALRTRLLVARVALASGDEAVATRQLWLARRLCDVGTATDRIDFCQARALLYVARGERSQAERQLRKGLALLDDYRAVLGAAELRATASGIGAELSRLGLRLAIESREPEKILAWAERLRGNALRLSLVRPPADPKLGAFQTQLRQVGDQMRAAEERGTAAPALAARQSALETAIRDRTRLLRGDGNGTPAFGGAPLSSEASPALAGRVLVEYVALDGALAALTLAEGRLRFHELGVDSSAEELGWLRFALGRLARGGSPSSRRPASSSARAAAAALDRLLVEPLAAELGRAPVVLVPTGALHAVPWAALPSFRRRPLTVAPSLAVWLELARRPGSRRRRTCAIAGPRLRHAAAEVHEVGEILESETVLSGGAATAKAALSALEGAALAHIACHGSFRADSPLFSSLELADGPLNVYELQGLRRAPDIVVLSACDLAVSALHPGDELLGLAAALLGIGTRTIIASVVPVPDGSARRTMLAFHGQLARGESPAVALAQAQGASAVPGFVCLGSGER